MQEIGVRVALGAPRVRLIVQTALENVVLCALGGALAIFVAAAALGATSGFMRALLGDNMPFWWVWSLDAEVVAAACLLLALDGRGRLGAAGLQREPSGSERAPEGRRARGRGSRRAAFRVRS